MQEIGQEETLYLLLRYRDIDEISVVAFIVAAENESEHESMTYEKPFSSVNTVKWCQAMDEEMESLQKNYTWELLDKPKDQKLCSWFDAITNRFSPDMFEDAMEEIASIAHTDELNECCNKFNRLLNKVSITESQAASLFLKGLKEEVKGPVKLFKPRTLHEAYRLARTQNVNNARLRLTQSSYNSKGSTFYSRSYNEPAKVLPPTNAHKLPLLPAPPVRKALPALAPLSSVNINPKRLSSKELELKRSKGECFWCTEKFVPGHKCARNQLYLIEVDDEGFMADELQEEHEPVISINALLGLHSYSTMKVQGSVGTRRLYILIDSGSTHNFVDIRVAKKLQCVVKDVKPLTISVADGKQMVCSQVFSHFQWCMNGKWFTAEVFLIPLQNYDMILEVQWLMHLNDILWNFKNMIMSFTIDGTVCELKGVENNKVSVCSLEKMDTLLQKQSCVMSSQLFSLQLAAIDNESHYESQILHSETIVSLQQLLQEYDDVFQTPKTLPPPRVFDHKIFLKEGSEPINQKPYRYPMVQKDIIEKMTRELMESGIIRESCSDFAAPVVKLNDATIKNKFPIPLIEELLDELGQATVFSKLDLRSDYHQVRMCPSDIPKTAFRTHEGHYEFLVMPFGLTNAPATFQALMNHVFKPLLRKCVLVFFDDILVYSKNQQQHLTDLQMVFTLLRDHQLYVKQSKCTFGGSAVKYLGHIISSEGVSIDPVIIEAVKNWPFPTTLKQLRGFLGLAWYYRRFIRSFGVIAKPLSVLLKKDAFGWNPQAQHAFESLKLALSSAPVLAFQIILNHSSLKQMLQQWVWGPC
ncbi:uncharacterized protein LOC143612235 [Bidens hawaiensis]|uniref:uncharacterized protein LOC143612235 n=1 Tax=Bidens hawaiensis TaxID=980011 RepID=UPI0040499848